MFPILMLELQLKMSMETTSDISPAYPTNLAWVNILRLQVEPMWSGTPMAFISVPPAPTYFVE